MDTLVVNVQTNAPFLLLIDEKKFRALSGDQETNWLSLCQKECVYKDLDKSQASGDMEGLLPRIKNMCLGAGVSTLQLKQVVVFSEPGVSEMSRRLHNCFQTALRLVRPDILVRFVPFFSLWAQAFFDASQPKELLFENAARISKEGKTAFVHQFSDGCIWAQIRTDTGVEEEEKGQKDKVLTWLRKKLVHQIVSDCSLTRDVLSDFRFFPARTKNIFLFSWLRIA